MKHHAAPHKQALKKRVNRFFNSSTKCRADVYDFVDIITHDSEFDVYAFGGLVRDIGLFGVRDFSSDVDLVVDTNRTTLTKALDRLPKDSVTANKFGGFRIKKGLWDIDIWCAKDTWAIKNKLVKYDGIESLLQTTFLSWDSALFDLKNNKLICTDNYLENLESGQIDVVLKESPNELGSLVRLARAIYSKGAYTVGPKAVETLKSCLERYSYESVQSYEKRSYAKHYLTTSNLLSLHKCVENADRDVSSLTVVFEKQQLDLLDHFLPTHNQEKSPENLLVCTKELERLRFNTFKNSYNESNSTSTGAKVEVNLKLFR